MELVYTVSKQQKGKYDCWMEDEPICLLSSRNIVAFTSTQQLTEQSGDRYMPNYQDTFAVQHHVYICDLDRPWDLHCVCHLNHRVVLMDWDSSGNRLILADATGSCQVWSMKEHLLNKWECTGTACMKGENTVALKWLHNGISVIFNAEKKESSIYTEKFAHKKFKPSLSHFGGKSTDSWIAVTATGLICVGMTTGDGEMIIQKDSLTANRTRIRVADIAFDGNGDISIVASDGSVSSTIQCYKVTLKAEVSTCKITCVSHASFYAECHKDPVLKDSSSACITELRFVSKNKSDNVIVCAGDTYQGQVEFWSLSEQTLPLHSHFQNKTESTYQIQKWVHKASVTHSSIPIAIATPTFPISAATPDSGFFQFIAVSFKDGSLKVVNSNTFQAISSTNLENTNLETSDREKRRKVIPHMTSMQQTFTGCGLVGVDQNNYLYLIKTANTRDPVMQISFVNIISMLEYVMFTGYDYWDVLLSIRPGMIEAVIQKLTDNFKKQPRPNMELLYSRYMAIKTALYRCSSSGHQQRAADCQCKLLLSSIATVFKSVLRPKSITGQDKSPADKLYHTCSKNADIDLDKVVLTLNPDKKEFFVEPAVLQSLQHLIQWVSDLTLYLLASIPMFQGYSNYPGGSIVRDITALSTLRELLVLIRIWGLISASCLPVFTATSSNFDSLSQLFKLLTKVWIACNENYVEYDDGLIDECCLLPSQLLVTNLDQGLGVNCGYASSIFQQQHPIRYTYGNSPENDTSASIHPLPYLHNNPLHKQDIVHQVHFGITPSEDTKQCSRCGALSVLKSTSKSAVMRAWDQGWSKTCLCGGHWKLAHHYD